MSDALPILVSLPLSVAGAGASVFGASVAGLSAGVTAGVWLVLVPSAMLLMTSDAPPMCISEDFAA